MTSNAVEPLKALLDQPGVAQVLDAIAVDGDEAWLVGGCVRNALLGEPVNDIDIAAQAEPPIVIERLESAGIKAVPTGIDHGTVTAVLDGASIEVTTLRRDVETDGRHAVIAFSRDIAEDAARRDFTMNALYTDRNAVLIDPENGLEDLDARRLRFIGDASARIQEDYLRSLRFFRFYAWYGRGAPDREAIKAIVANKSGLESLSAERVWSELKKLLAAPNVARGLLWMRQSGVYQLILPESGHMDGFARVMRLSEAVGAEDEAVDPLRRLMALLPLGDGARVNELSKRLKLSNAERDRLVATMSVYKELDTGGLADQQALRAALYTHGQKPVQDLLVLQAAARLDADPELDLPQDVVDRVGTFIRFADTWQKPEFPVAGQDLVDRGVEPGPQLGAALKIMEGAWVASDFQMDREALLAVLKS